MIERETDNITLCDTSPLQQATDSLQTLLPAVFLALIYLLVPFGLLIKIFFTVPEIEKVFLFFSFSCPLVNYNLWI